MVILGSPGLPFRILDATPPRVPPVHSLGTPDREPVDADRGEAHADRHALAVLAAGPDAPVEGEVVTDARDALEHVGAVADQGRSLHRGADATVLDPVGLVGGE